MAGERDLRFVPEPPPPPPVLCLKCGDYGIVSKKGLPVSRWPVEVPYSQLNRVARPCECAAGIAGAQMLKDLADVGWS